MIKSIFLLYFSQNRRVGDSAEERRGLTSTNPLFCMCIFLLSGKRRIFPEILFFFFLNLTWHRFVVV